MRFTNGQSLLQKTFLRAPNTEPLLHPNIGACGNEALLGTRVTELATLVGG
jgi:hypothetical protein